MRPYFMAIMFVLSVTILEIHCQNDHNLNLDPYNGPVLNLNMPIEWPCATYNLLAIAMLALSVTVSVILAVEMCMTLNLIFRMNQGQSTKNR